jgi:hypothetical protein
LSKPGLVYPELVEGKPTKQISLDIMNKITVDLYFCTMKLLAFAVLLISIAATIVPCCEFDDCQDEVGASHPDKKEQKGTCSPFSTCAVCSGSIVITKTIQLVKPAISKDQFTEIAIPSFSPSYFPSFWQPPRLS